MQYLVAAPRGATEAVAWAPDGEPVVPNFPTGARNTFLGVGSFKPVPHACVVETATVVRGFDVDAIATELKTRYPGLPARMLDTYVIETARLATMLPVGTLVQTYIDDDGERVTVRVVNAPDNDMNVAIDDVYELWTKQPIPEGLR